MQSDQLSLNKAYNVLWVTQRNKKCDENDNG